MSLFKADLHIHTALSPCGADEMTPPEIVRSAIQRGLDMIAICDHNSAGNVAAVLEAAGEALAVIPGIEITTAEEAHVLGLFPSAERASALAQCILANLPLRDQATSRFGEQRLFNALGRVIGVEPKLLSLSSGFGLAETIVLIRAYRGLSIAAHLDRPSFSVISQLGIFPKDVGFDAVELSSAGCRAGREREFEQLGLPILTGSDSHSLSEIGSAFTLFEMKTPSFDELALCLRGENGRRILGTRST